MVIHPRSAQFFIFKFKAIVVDKNVNCSPYGTRRMTLNLVLMFGGISWLVNVNVKHKFISLIIGR